MIEHSKEYGIYHWDTFDNTTALIDEADTLEDAIRLVYEHYSERMRPDGADQVDIVDSEGKVVRKYKVG